MARPAYSRGRGFAKPLYYYIVLYYLYYTTGTTVYYHSALLQNNNTFCWWQGLRTGVGQLIRHNAVQNTFLKEKTLDMTSTGLLCTSKTQGKKFVGNFSDVQTDAIVPARMSADPTKSRNNISSKNSRILLFFLRTHCLNGRVEKNSTPLLRAIPENTSELLIASARRDQHKKEGRPCLIKRGCAARKAT